MGETRFLYGLSAAGMALSFSLLVGDPDPACSVMEPMPRDGPLVAFTQCLFIAPNLGRLHVAPPFIYGKLIRGRSFACRAVVDVGFLDVLMLIRAFNNLDRPSTKTPLVVINAILLDIVGYPEHRSIVLNHPICSTWVAPRLTSLEIVPLTCRETALFLTSEQDIPNDESPLYLSLDLYKQKVALLSRVIRYMLEPGPNGHPDSYLAIIASQAHEEHIPAIIREHGLAQLLGGPLAKASRLVRLISGAFSALFPGDVELEPVWNLSGSYSYSFHAAVCHSLFSKQKARNRCAGFRGCVEIDAVGAGVALGTNALRALKEIGLLDPVLALVDANDRDREMVFVSGSGQHDVVHTYAKDASIPCSRRISGRLKRRTFQQTLYRDIHFCFWWPHVALSDSTTHEADVVIDAEGIISVTRSTVIDPEQKVVQFTNSVAYRGWSPRKNYAKSVGGVSLAAGCAGRVRRLGADVQILVEHLKTSSKWYIHTVRPLQTFVKGQIASVGDAARAMPPHLGAGVGQGFENVFVLCELLGNPATKLSNIGDVFRAHDVIRRPRANEMLERSIRAGHMYGTPGYRTPADIDRHLGDIWEPIWTPDLDADVASAIESLRGAGHF
ncbi:hypothetical protein B0H17DRAFT_1129170 [Mycena rosella]|uniref:Uncharacterized protein n=1 Tax=Mycena rosella TaxID=1033263 RepID=A0AAD7DUA6_MYCRO|nr:hypothetical protein B0H17DRAFT_1129170 [Mycena rosella]